MRRVSFGFFLPSIEELLLTVYLWSIWLMIWYYILLHMFCS